MLKIEAPNHLATQGIRRVGLREQQMRRGAIEQTLSTAPAERRKHLRGNPLLCCIVEAC
jgi:hypothetical protein